MRLKMTLDEALAFADEWSRGMTLHEDAQGWRVVCMLLAAEVERLRHEITLTLEENGHLADGDVCTLIRLKNALRSN